MMWNYGSSFGNGWYPGMLLGNMMAGLTFLFIPLLVWSLFWKGWALWRAAKNDSKPWFIALLVINTAGILEILYLFVFGKKASRKK